MLVSQHHFEFRFWFEMQDYLLTGCDTGPFLRWQPSRWWQTDMPPTQDMGAEQWTRDGGGGEGNQRVRHRGGLTVVDGFMNALRRKKSHWNRTKKLIARCFWRIASENRELCHLFHVIGIHKHNRYSWPRRNKIHCRSRGIYLPFPDWWFWNCICENENEWADIATWKFRMRMKSENANANRRHSNMFNSLQLQVDERYL